MSTLAIHSPVVTDPVAHNHVPTFGMVLHATKVESGNSPLLVSELVMRVRARLGVDEVELPTGAIIADLMFLGLFGPDESASLRNDSGFHIY